MRFALPSQVEFPCLSIPDLQNDFSMADGTRHDIFSWTGSSYSATGQDSSVHIANVTFENAATALLAVAALSYAHHANHTDSDDTDECLLQATLTRRYDPERLLQTCVAHPPKRFYRTFWRSITWRLFKHATRSSVSRSPYMNKSSLF